MTCEGAGYELVSEPIPAPLRPFVDSWIGYREWSARPVERIEHPKGRAVLIFEFGEPIQVGLCGETPNRHRSGFFAGIDDKPAWTCFTGEQAGIEVNLTPEGAFAFTRGAVRNLKNLIVEAEEFDLPRNMGARLGELGSWTLRFRAVATELERRIAGARPMSALVRHALRLIDSEGGALRVDEVSRRLSVSRKYLHERFVTETGFAPKRYATIRRFTRARDMLLSGQYASLSQISMRAGYSDQAHLSREVRRFAGLAPTELVRKLEDPVAVEVSRLLNADGV